MMSTENMPIEKLFYHSLQYSSIYMNKVFHQSVAVLLLNNVITNVYSLFVQSSLSCALLSAGSVCEVTKKVILGDVSSLCCRNTSLSTGLGTSLHHHTHTACICVILVLQ